MTQDTIVVVRLRHAIGCTTLNLFGTLKGNPAELNWWYGDLSTFMTGILGGLVSWLVWSTNTSTLPMRHIDKLYMHVGDCCLLW